MVAMGTWAFRFLFPFSDFRSPVNVMSYDVTVDVCGSCGVIEESSPLRGGFVSPLIRDLESRRDVLTGQSAGYGQSRRTTHDITTHGCWLNDCWQLTDTTGGKWINMAPLTTLSVSVALLAAGQGLTEFLTFESLFPVFRVLFF